MDKHYKNIYFNRGMVFLGIEDYKRAAIEFTKAIHEDSRDSEAYENRAFTYYNLKKIFFFYKRLYQCS